MKNTIKILCLILLATFSLSSFACAGGKTTENNICENLEKEQACILFTENLFKGENQINYSEITAYTQKELELRKDIRNTIKESMPTGSVGNAWVWSNDGNNLIRANTGNQLNYNVEFKPLNITSHLALLGSVYKRDRVASAKEKIDEAIGNLYSTDAVKKAEAYSFLNRIIRTDNHCLHSYLKQCVKDDQKPKEPPKSRHEIEIKPTKIEIDLPEKDNK